jgi:hypothetical protein
MEYFNTFLFHRLKHNVPFIVAEFGVNNDPFMLPSTPWLRRSGA